MMRWAFSGVVVSGFSVMQSQPASSARTMYSSWKASGEVTMTDRWLGRFLDKMEGLNLFENTLLILLSDHGVAHGEHGYTGKPDNVLIDVDPDARTRFAVTMPRRVAHVRLTIVPDGGVARLRLLGDVVDDLRAEGGSALYLPQAPEEAQVPAGAPGADGASGQQA